MYMIFLLASHLKEQTMRGQDGRNREQREEGKKK
jgi:hypothetical protein